MLLKGQNPDGSVIYGAALRTLTGEKECGDGFLFHSTDNHVLIALIDGLGHGSHAHAAAEAAIEYLKEFADQPIEPMLQKTHGEMRSNRGAVAFVGKINLSSKVMECASIGNIGFKLNVKSEKKQYMLPVPGVIGHTLKRIVVNDIELADGDEIILHSDGISSRFKPEELEAVDPAERATEIVNRFGYDHDDASVLIVKVDFKK